LRSHAEWEVLSLNSIQTHFASDELSILALQNDLLYYHIQQLKENRTLDKDVLGAITALLYSCNELTGVQTERGDQISQLQSFIKNNHYYPAQYKEAAAPILLALPECVDPLQREIIPVPISSES
jgi:hypothetical protein